MLPPLIIAAFLLAGVCVAGLFVDTRASMRHSTRAFGVSALIIKFVLTVGFVSQALHARSLPVTLYEEFGEHVTFFALVTVGVPLVAVALTCELAAIDRFRHTERSLPEHAQRSSDEALAVNDG